MLEGILAASALLLTIVSCNPREPGCLDLEATNFDVTADQNDESLCSYPNMLLNVTYSWGDTSFSTNEFYENDHGQLLAVEDVYIIFSQFLLNAQNEGPLVVEDRVKWWFGDQSGGEYGDVVDDFTLVDRTGFRYTLGEWRTSDFVDQVQFFVGVPDSITPTVPDSLPDNHVLNQPKILYDEAVDRFATARLVVAPDTGDVVLDTFHLDTGPLAYIFPLAKELIQGGNDTVRVEIDFEVLLGNVDLTLDSAMVVQMLEDNLAQSVIDDN